MQRKSLLKFVATSVAALVCVSASILNAGEAVKALATICRNGKSVEVYGDGSIVVRTGKAEFKYAVAATEALNVVCDGDAIAFFLKQEKVPFEVRAKLGFAADGNPELRLMRDPEAKGVRLVYPGALVVGKGDVALIPHGEGLAIPVEDPEGKLFEISTNLCGAEWQLAMIGHLRGEAWSAVSVENAADARVHNTRKDGLFSSQIVWAPQKGKWGYDRVVRFIVGESGSLNSLCADYREYRESLGTVATLRDKQKKVAHLDRLPGSASFWIWPDRYEDFMYGKDPNAELKPSSDDILRIACELKSAGCDRAMIGLFFATTQPIAAEIVKRTGYLVHKYDNMEDELPGKLVPLIPKARIRENDTIERRAKYWPNDTVVTVGGGYAGAWALRGTDGVMHSQNRTCPHFVGQYVKDEVPALAKKYGFNAWFFDVMGFGGIECYSAKHPMNNTSSINERRKAFAVLADNNLISGTEEGSEFYIGCYCYTEGKMSPRFCRIDYQESGRKKAHLYTPDEYESQFLKLMLSPKYRIPLWELIYHDCSVNYWYWGDSSNCCPELMPLRDLFNVLYAQPPLYSFHVNEWETLKPRILKSLSDACVSSRMLGFERMTKFEYLTTDRLVQQTTFSNGVRVTANFSDKPFTMKDGIVVSPRSVRIEK